MKNVYFFNEKTLVYEKAGKKVIKWAAMTALFTLITSFVIFKPFMATTTQINQMVEEKLLVIRADEDKFSEDKLKAYLKELNVRFPHIVMAQAVLETGNFTSTIFRDNNNLFGMKQATVRPSTNTGEQHGHATFKCWRESVLDYALYSAAYLKDIRTEDEYFTYLGAHYAEDPSYMAKIREMSKKYKEYFV